VALVVGVLVGVSLIVAAWVALTARVDVGNGLGVPTSVSVLETVGDGVVVTLGRTVAVGVAVAEGVATLVGDSALVPRPLNKTDCGLPVALSVNTRLAVRVPVPWGVKATFTTQEPAGSNVTGLPSDVRQLVVPPKSGSVSFRVTSVIVSAAEPVLVTVTV
jgi:hypothetical protein